MGSFCDSERVLFELLHRVLHDSPPRPVGLVYLYGQSPDNEDSVLDRGAELILCGAVKKVAIIGTEKGYGYNGGDAWHKKLCKSGVNPEQILKIMPIESPFPPCTDYEADALIAAIADTPSLSICASPFHQVRAFVSTISAMRRAGKFLRIFNSVGMPVDWMADVVHSQGVEKGVRKDLLAAELGRLNDYCGKGRKTPSLLRAEEILDYLNERDRPVA